MSFLILVVDDEPDVEALFRQQFRRDLRAGRFTTYVAQSALAALQCISVPFALSGKRGSRNRPKRLTDPLASAG